MLASGRPYGPVIRAGWPGKIRGAVVLQAAGQWPYWAQFWRDWDWTTVARTIDTLASVGVNCLQVTATGLADNGVAHPDVPTMRGRIGQLARYAAGKRMVLNPQLGYQPGHSFAGGAAAATAAAAAMAGLFAEQANIGFIDAMNEVNYYGGPGWSGPNVQCLSDMGGFVAGIRAVTGAIAVSVSVGCSVASDITGAWMQAMAPLSDFHNLHTYYYGSVSGAPSGADFAGLRAAPWYLGRFVVGETGMPSGNGAAAQSAWLNGNGAVAGGPDCLGSILWGATDTSSAPGRGENVSEFGMMDTSGTGLRAALATPVQGWPGAL